MKLYQKFIVVVLGVVLAGTMLHVLARSFANTREDGRMEIRDSLANAALSTWRAPVPRPRWTTVRLCEERIVKVPVSGLEPERFNAQKIGVCHDSVVRTSDFNGALP